MYAGSLPPEYRLGDVAADNIFTPVVLQVVNPDASAGLKQKTASQVPLVFRRVVTAADEAEADMRASFEAARSNFLTALRQAVFGRAPYAGDINTLAYERTVRDITLAEPNHPPIARLAPLWVRGVSDQAVLESMLQPVRDVMTQPIAAEVGEKALAVDLPIRLIEVKSLFAAPSMAELDKADATTTAADLSSLEWARSVVESYFSAEQTDLARYAAAFLRANTFPAPGLTELLRAKRSDGVVVYDTYVAGQILVRKGQVIDHKAVAALATLREKKLIEALFTKVESPPAAPGWFDPATKKFALGLGAACAVLFFILWRWGASANRTALPIIPQPVLELPAVVDDGSAESWRTRALLAEQKAQVAHEAIRQGALGWMRDKIFRSMYQQRADMLSTQQLAEAEVAELEQRLEQLLVPLQGRIKAYEKRIAELEDELATQDGRDPRIIDARISGVRQQLEVERARVSG